VKFFGDKSSENNPVLFVEAFFFRFFAMPNASISGIHGGCGLPGCGDVAAVGRDLRLREVASFRRGVVGQSHRGSRRFVKDLCEICFLSRQPSSTNSSKLSGVITLNVAVGYASEIFSKMIANQK
jgi:hypothetical protein